jgi:hypothetical protein
MEIDLLYSGEAHYDMLIPTRHLQQDAYVFSNATIHG